MESELKSIEENGTWELSGLVAKGYQENEKVDCKELFAPVVKPTNLRTLLAGATIKGWVVKQMDVTTAFLNGILEEEIFRAQPEGFDDGSGRVWKLKKALYGLKQAPRQWYLKLREVLEEIGFTPSSADHSLVMLGEGEQRSFMVVYVDDILIFSRSSDHVKEVMLKLQDKFKCKALGDVSFYLGLHIERDCVKGPEEESVGEEERCHFHSLVGSLMYAAVNTRPDDAFATGQLARVVQCPNDEQVAAGMRVAKYLGQTPTVGLQYLAAAQRRQKGADCVEPVRLFLTAFSDASYSSQPEDMTSVGGFICCVGGGPTAWESKKQVDQALSSVESEYMALFRAVWEIVWQRRLLAELGEEQQGSTLLYCDSQGAIALAKNPVLHGLTKHMRVKWHWTRSMVAAGEVELHYVKTTRQPADMMTKRLVEQQHWKPPRPSARCSWPPGPSAPAAATATTAAIAATNTATAASAAPSCYATMALLRVLAFDHKGRQIQSDSLSGLHLPSFSTNFVSTADLQDAIVTTTTPRGSASVDLHVYTDGPSPGHVHSSTRVESVHPGYRSKVSVSPPTLACPALPSLRRGAETFAPHSSSFPPTIAPLQTLHMDVLVVDDYTRYTTVFPLRSKGLVVDVLIPWIRAVRLQLRERFSTDLPVLRLWEFCSGEGIRQSFTLPASPQRNGIAKCRICLVMEVTRTSMIHAAAPHFLWPFAVRYAAHQLNLCRRPRPHCIGQGRLAMRLCSGSGVLVTLSSIRPRTSSPPAPFPTSSLALSLAHLVGTFTTLPRAVSSPLRTSHFTSRFPFTISSPTALPLSLPRRSSLLQVPLRCRIKCYSRYCVWGSEPGSGESGSAEPGGAELGGTETRGAELGGSAGASPRLSLQQLREWLVLHARLRSGASRAGGAGAAGAGGAGVPAGAGGTGGTAATDPKESGAAGGSGFGAGGAGAGGAGVGGTGARGAGVGGAGAGGVGAGGAGAVDPGGAVRPRPSFFPLLEHPVSPVPAPSPYTEQSGGLAERSEPASRRVSPVSTACCVPCSCPPPVPGTYAMALRPSSVPLRVVKCIHYCLIGCSGVVHIGRAAPLFRATPPCRAVPPGAEPRRPTELRRPAESRRPTEPHCPARAAPTATPASAITAATAATTTMASPNVLAFDAEGHAVDFHVWVDDLQLFLQCDSKDGVSLFDHTSGDSPALAATADSTVRSQWTTRDAVARLAVRSHLPSAESAHFGQYKTAMSLYDAVVARYSSPTTAALSRLMLLYVFSDLAAFATIADLITHLRTSDARYRTALPTDQGPISLPLPHQLTVDLLEERLTAAEKSIVAVGASRGDPRAPFFAGCYPVPLLPSVASAAAVDLVRTEEVGAASAPSGRCRNSKGKGGKGGGGDGGGGGGGGGGGEGGGGGGGGGGGSGGFGGGGGDGGGSGSDAGGSDSGGGGGGGSGAGGVGPCTYVLRTGGRRGETCGLPHTAQLCLDRQTDAWRAQFPDAVELPRWGVVLKRNVAIFDLHFDAILATMYAITDSAEGDCFLCVPPDPGIEAAALGASASAAPGTSESAAPRTSESTALGAGESSLSVTAPTEALHTFTLDSGASRSFFRDTTTLTPLSRPVAISLANPSRGPVLAHSSTVLPCPAAPSGLLSRLHLPSFSTNLVSGADLQDLWVDQFTPGGQRVTHCTCSRTGRHLATFTRRSGSSLYTLTTTSPLVTVSGQVAASGQVFVAVSRSRPVSAPCSCRPLSHETLLWNHHLGHPSLPRLRGMASCTLVSGLPRSLPPLPPEPAPTCVPCVEGRQRADPHSSEFPPTEAPLQTLHMDVWGPARVRGQGHERFFLLVVDDYSHYTTVFPLRRKGEVTEPFMLPASLQKNGIAERRIGMVMDVAHTSMIHAAAPHFLWPSVVQYAAHQINLSFVRDTSADKLSSHAVPCVFLEFPLDAPGWQFYHPTLRRVLSSRTSHLTSRYLTTVSFPTALPLSPPPPLFLAPGAPPVDHLPPQRPAPSGVSQVDPVENVEVAVDSGSARGSEPTVAESEGAEPGGAEPERVEPSGAEPWGAESRGAEPRGAEPERAESGGPPGVPSRREPFSLQRLRECASKARAAGGAAGAGAAGSVGPGGAGAGGTIAVGGPTGLGPAGGAGAAGPGDARTGGTGAAGAGGAAGVEAVGARAVATGGAAGARAAGGTGAGGAAGVVARDPRAEGTGIVSTISGGAAWPLPYYVPLLQQVLGLPPSTGPTLPLLSPPLVQSLSQLQPASPLPGPSPYSGLTRGLTERREPESRPASPESLRASPESRPESPVRAIRTGRRVPR
ncbi:unnamed protein product [Closterium sp. NIES-54]